MTDNLLDSSLQASRRTHKLSITSLVLAGISIGLGLIGPAILAIDAIGDSTSGMHALSDTVSFEWLALPIWISTPLVVITGLAGSICGWMARGTSTSWT